MTVKVSGCLGAIIGDIVGSPYEFDQNNCKSEDFPLYSRRSYATDDSVMTLAVAEAMIRTRDGDAEAARAACVESMAEWGKRYPYAGYGTMFSRWFDDRKPYGSYGNGSAMRVSSVGWLFDDLDIVLERAAISSAVSHDHPEGIKGAQATAAAIFLTRKGMGKDELRRYITERFEYDLTRTCDEIRPTYKFVETCQETVPEALTAYFEGESFEGVLRKAVSLGGDSDTLTAIAASVAGAAHDVPDSILDGALARLDDHQLASARAYVDAVREVLKL